MIDIYSKSKFNIREGDFEVSISHSNLNDKEKITPELVKYYKSDTSKSGEYCCSLAIWHYDKNEPCWEMESVGERLFTEVPANKIKSVWEMMKLLDHYLNYAGNDTGDYN